MSERSSYAEGTPSWVDLGAEDFDGARKFYGSLFGWEIPPGDENFGNYSNATKNGKTVAGMAPRMDESQPSAWTTYIAVDDADATAQKIKDNGGQVVVEPMTVGEFGRMAIAIDPQGAGFGLWQAMQHTGAQLVNEPGSFSWAEVFTSDGKGADEFYTGVFGFNLQVLDGGPDVDYTMFNVGEKTVAGRMVMAEAPPHWGIYFGVEDTDAALAKTVELGGSVLRDAEDTPYGRLATAADPTGASFRLVAANEAMPEK